MNTKCKKIFASVLAATMLPVCGTLPTAPTAAAAAKGTVVRLDPSQASPFNGGRFEGWGTSLCWWANRLGYSESLTQQAADAFFSEEGLGLDIARYNLGGGDDPTHNHITRSDSKIPGYATGFDDEGNIVYDWTVDENQRNITLAALEANPELYVEGFSNSPPYFMTNSGCTSGAVDAGSDNLNPEYYDEFGKFIADVTLHFRDEFGIEFKSYSPMNEPDTTYWGANSPKQEGCHFSPGTTQSETIIATRNALDAAGLTDVLVAGMDETDLGKTVKNYALLTEEAKQALGRIDTHTYSGSDRAGAKATAVNAGKDLWMSEVDGGWNGEGLANRIIADLNGMQASAWVLWDIVDFHRDSKFQAPDGSYPEANNSLNPTGSMWGVGMADHDTETLHLANKYYYFGQFTKFINPGDTLIASSSNTLAAYNKDTGAIKIVALNSSGSNAAYTFDVSAFAKSGNMARVVRTNNSDEKWKELGMTTLSNKQLSYTLPAHSVTTFIIEQDPAITLFEATETGLTYSYTAPEGYDSYLAVYDSENKLVCVTLNENEKTIEGSFAGCTPKLFIWDEMAPVTNAITEVTVPESFDKYAIIKGGGTQIPLGATIELTVDTNMEGDIVWSSSDESVATVTAEGAVTAIAPGEVTIRAAVGDFVVSREFAIPLYTLIGTASWTDGSARPADSADYTKVADGDLSTFFDGSTGGWVRYDYGSPFVISSIQLAARSGAGMPERTVGAVIQASNDGIAWTDIYTITEAIPADEYTTITADMLSDNSAYRYYRYINTAAMANIAEFIIDGELSDNIADGEPVITDLAEFTDSFESNSNIFGAANGAMWEGGNVVFASGLDRFGNAFAPVRSTATSALAEAKTLTANDKFRLTFDMFAGWESSGKENTFALKDAEGNELVAIYITGGGYTLQELRIGGVNVLETTAVAQCRSNIGTSKDGANGWNASGQPYVNTVGYNKHVEITIDGTGIVNVAFTGGMADTTAEGVIATPISIGSIELTGDYNGAAERTVSYDNLDGDIITYAEELAAPTPTPTPTEAPVIPESGEIINLSFDNGDLTSTSAYGTASGSPVFTTADEKACMQINGSSNVVTLTDPNGNGLLGDIDEMIISFRIKPASTACSWILFTAPNDSAQTYQQEKYLGIRTQDGNLHIERYNNTGARSAATSGAIATGVWSDVLISVAADKTTLYINGVAMDEDASTVDLSDMLGKSSVAYLGKANWGTGEFANFHLDDFIIRTGSIPNPLSDFELGDLSAVTENLTLPTTLEDGTAVTWASSDEEALGADGTVVRFDDKRVVTLTATAVSMGVSISKDFVVTIPGYADVMGTFTAYAEDGAIKFVSEYDDEVIYDMYVELTDADNSLVGEVAHNTAEGTYADLALGTYKIKCTLKEGETVKREVTKTVKVKEELEMGAYLFTHFIGTQETAAKEQIYFSVSTDGSTWTTLNGGQPMLTSNVGTLGVRDPHIIRSEDGKFFIIATDLSIYNNGNNWGAAQTAGSKSIVIWESDDLVNWSEARLVQVAPDNAGCTWAPEAVYDADRDAYMVFWASKTATDNYAVQRMYKSYTTDFVTFTEPEIYIDGGNVSNIDTTIINDKGIYYRFTKNESRSSVTMMKSTSLSEGWEDVATYTINGTAGNTVTGYEGPTVYKLNGDEDKWCMLLDFYSQSKGYKPFVTSDITKGEFTSAADFTFDDTYRHGTVMPITMEEYQALVDAY